MRWRPAFLAAVAVALVGYGLMIFGPPLDRQLRAYARLCEGHEQAWYPMVREVPLQEVGRASGSREPNTKIPALAEPGFVFNAIEDDQVYSFRSEGMLYIALHAWKGFYAGVCVPMTPDARRDKDLEYHEVSKSRWLYWRTPKR
jgi:hypothetical protein